MLAMTDRFPSLQCPRTTVMSVLSAIGDFVGPLHPLLALVESLCDDCKQISINKSECRGVAVRAGTILETINKQLKDAANWGGDEVQQNIRFLEMHFEWIRDTMYDMSRWGKLKCILRSKEMHEAVEDSHRRLDDVCRCFVISALVEVQHNQKTIEEARKEDAEVLQRLLLHAGRRDADLLRALEINQKQQMDALRALQRALEKTAEFVESAERKLLTLGLQTLQRTTGQRLPKQLPEWHIAIYELDIDKDSNLGQGAFAVVKKAIWIGRTVAVKLLSPGTSPKRLLKEMTVWQRLRHEHVLLFLGASETADPPFLVSKYMKNGNAEEYLSQHPNANRTLLLHQVALGMAYLHERGVIHGDLKASNILIDDAGNACVADFGLSRLILDVQSRTTTKVGSIAGTARFMAPEQMGGNLVQQSDVYSYGMLIYQLFTDEVPFGLVPEQAIVYHITILHARLERPEGEEYVSIGLTDDMWNLVMQCSAPTPGERPTFDRIYRATGRLSESHQRRLREEESSLECDTVSLPSLDGHTDTDTDIAVVERTADVSSGRRSSRDTLRPSTPDSQAKAALANYLPERSRIRTSHAKETVATEVKRDAEMIASTSSVDNTDLSMSTSETKPTLEHDETIKTITMPTLESTKMHSVASGVEGNMETSDQSGSVDITHPAVPTDRKTAQTTEVNEGETPRLSQRGPAKVEADGFESVPETERPLIVDHVKTEAVEAGRDTDTADDCHDEVRPSRPYSYTKTSLKAQRTETKHSVPPIAYSLSKRTPLFKENTESVAFVSDGRLISGSAPSFHGHVRIWDVYSRRVVKELDMPELDKTRQVNAPQLSRDRYSVNRMAASADASRVVCTDGLGSVCVWNTITGDPVVVRDYSFNRWRVDISHKGSRVVRGPSPLKVWDVEDGRLIPRTFASQENMAFDAVAISPDGTLIVAAKMTRRGGMCLWYEDILVSDVSYPLDTYIWDMTFSNDGTQIVTGSSDGTVRIFDAGILDRVGKPFVNNTPSTSGLGSQEVVSVGISSDGRSIVSGTRSVRRSESHSGDCTVCIWDARTERTSMPPLKVNGSLNSVAISADARQVAVGTDVGLQLWDLSAIRSLAISDA